jgi:hypothetical protein
MLCRSLVRGFQSCCIAAVVGFSLLATAARGEDEVGLALAPDNADVLAVVEVGKIIESPAFKQLESQLPDLAKKLDEPLGNDTKLTPRSIESIFVAANSASQEFVVVISLTEEMEVKDLLSADKRGQATKIGDYTLYAVENDQVICFVDETTIAIAPKKTLTAVLKRDDEAEISDELNEAWENVDADQHIYVVATLDKLAKQGAAALPEGFPIKPEVLGKLKAAAFTATASKKHFALSTTLNCTDTKTANQLKGLLDVVIMGAMQPDANTPPEFKQVLKGLKSEADEDSLTINVNVAYDLLLEQFKGQLGDAISAE